MSLCCSISTLTSTIRTQASSAVVCGALNLLQTRVQPPCPADMAETSASFLECLRSALVAHSSLRQNTAVTSQEQLERIIQLVAPVTCLKGMTPDLRIYAMFDILEPLMQFSHLVCGSGEEAFREAAGNRKDFVAALHRTIVRQMASTESVFRAGGIALRQALDVAQSADEIEAAIAKIRTFATEYGEESAQPVASAASTAPYVPRVAAITNNQVATTPHQRYCVVCKKTSHNTEDCYAIQRLMKQKEEEARGGGEKARNKRGFAHSETRQTKTEYSAGHEDKAVNLGKGPKPHYFSPFVPGLVDGRMVSMLIDTGAPATVCSRAFAELHHCTVCQAESKLHAANGSELSVLGETNFEFMLLDGRSLPLSAIVLQDLFCDLILGTDQMFDRPDGLDVTIGRVHRADAIDATDVERAVCVRFGASGSWITPSQLTDKCDTIRAIRAGGTGATRVPPAVLELDVAPHSSTSIYSITGSTETRSLSEIASDAQDSLQYRLLYDASRAYELPEELVSPDAEEAQPRYPIGLTWRPIAQ